MASNKQPTFEAAQHPLLLEWDYECNLKDGIHPSSTTLGSNKLVHWVCQKCPKGQLHQYQMRPMIVLKDMVAVVHIVPAAKCANATPWKLIIP